MWYYISGGERSGKTAYGMQLAEQLSPHPVYLATARILDDTMQQRVKQHIATRPDHWQTLTCEKHLHQAISNHQVVVIDCVTLWISNFFFDLKEDKTQTLQAVEQTLEALQQLNNDLIFVSNEIGMGLHGHTASTRSFTEIQGLVNQKIAHLADKAFFMVSGLPMTLK